MQSWRRLRARWGALPPRVVDAVLAGVLLVVEVGGQVLYDREAAAVITPGLAPLRAPVPLAAAFAAAWSLPLVWRRRAPVAVLAAVTGLVWFAVVAVGVPPSTSAVLFALFTVGVHCGRRTSLAAVAVLCAVTLVSFIPVAGVALAVAQASVLVGVWALGDRLQVQRAYVAELEQRAARAERDRETRARMAVADERARIARELHDVVAHSVSVMVVQATAARRTFRTRPEAADEALGQVVETGRRSLVEMRRLLGLLRAGDDGAADLAPQPGLADVPNLVAQFREAGLPVRLVVAGTPGPLPTGPDLSAYRIVQEALTNALKHAAATAVQVTVRYRPHDVEVEVTDDGRGAAGDLSGGTGHGIVGMRERAAVLGGSLDIGPGPSGGFRVRAQLPTDGG